MHYFHNLFVFIYLIFNYLFVLKGRLDTLVLHPYSSSHRNIPTDIKTKLGIRPGLIRLSTGIEALDDIIQDLNRGLNN